MGQRMCAGTGWVTSDQCNAGRRVRVSTAQSSCGVRGNADSPGGFAGSALLVVGEFDWGSFGSSTVSGLHDCCARGRRGMIGYCASIHMTIHRRQSCLPNSRPDDAVDPAGGRRSASRGEILNEPARLRTSRRATEKLNLRSNVNLRSVFAGNHGNARESAAAMAACDTVHDFTLGVQPNRAGDHRSISARMRRDVTAKRKAPQGQNASSWSRGMSCEI